jgi:hypothetical protein
VEVAHTKDPINPGFAVAAGLTARLAAPGQEPILIMGPAWKSSDSPGENWTQTGFDDKLWTPVLPWTKPGYNFPWAGSVWDTVAGQKLNITNPAAVIVADGNVRDYDTNEGFPLTNALRGVLDKDKYKVVFDPDNDAVFLRTPKAPAKLLTAGADGGPVGVPAPK